MDCARQPDSLFESQHTPHEIPHQRAAEGPGRNFASSAHGPGGEDVAHGTSIAANDEHGDQTTVLHSKTLRLRAPVPMFWPAMHGINFDEELEKIVAKDRRYTRE